MLLFEKGVSKSAILVHNYHRKISQHPRGNNIVYNIGKYWLSAAITAILISEIDIGAIFYIGAFLIQTVFAVWETKVNQRTYFIVINEAVWVVDVIVFSLFQL